MIHLSSFAAVHYRGLDGLSIPRLSAANLVTGENGIGKTALLEAIWLFVGRKIDGLHRASCGTVRFANQNAPKPRPNCIIEDAKYQQDDFEHYVKYYSEMVRDSRKDELTSILNVILPGIRGIEILIDESRNTYLSAVTADGEQLPVDHLGSGFVRLLRISLSMFMSRYGILLVDELENGIHYSALTDVWKHIRRWIEAWNVQIVATTHSDDCIDAAVAAFDDAPDDLSIHQLFVNGTTGRVDATTFTGEALEGARDLNLEVR